MPRLLLAGSTLSHIEPHHSDEEVDIHRCEDSLPAIQSAIGHGTQVLVVPLAMLSSGIEASLWQMVRVHSLLLLLVIDTPGEDGTDFILGGCSGVLRPDVSLEELKQIVPRVLAGEIWAPRLVISRALRRLLTTDAQPVLTTREQQIFELVTTGLTNQNVADMLCITRDTVRWHMRSIYSKLGRHAVQRTAKEVPQ